MNNSRELASIISLLLLILCRQSSTALLCRCFIQRRIRRRRLCLHFINAIAHSIYYLTAQHSQECLGSSTSTNVVSAATERSCTRPLVERKLQSYEGNFRVHMPACWTSTSSARYAYERGHPCREESGSKSMEIGNQ